jgi:hypothetical protein
MQQVTEKYRADEKDVSVAFSNTGKRPYGIPKGDRPFQKALPPVRLGGSPVLKASLRAFPLIKIKNGEEWNTQLIRTFHEYEIPGFLSDLYQQIKASGILLPEKEWKAGSGARDILDYLIETIRNVGGSHETDLHIGEKEDESLAFDLLYPHEPSIEGVVWFELCQLLPLRRKNRKMGSLMTDLFSVLLNQFGLNDRHSYYEEYTLEMMENCGYEEGDEFMEAEVKYYRSKRMDNHWKKVGEKRNLEQVIERWQSYRPRKEANQKMKALALNFLAWVKQGFSVSPLCYSPTYESGEGEEGLMPYDYLRMTWQLEGKFYESMCQSMDDTWGNHGSRPLTLRMPLADHKQFTESIERVQRGWDALCKLEDYCHTYFRI